MSRFPKPTIDQLRDESSLSGHAEGILNPTNEKEAAEMIRENKDLEIRFQGTRTGICGGSVPEGGLMLGTAFMKWVADPETDGDDLLSWVGAGVTLDQLEKPIRRNYPDYMWPPHPTEETATVGGIAALGSKGINACHYGETRKYIEAVKIIDRDGELHEITDPEELDRVIGSEGKDGLITQVKIRLVKKPEATWAVALFFEDEQDAAKCATEILGLFDNDPDVFITADEFLDKDSLDLLDAFREVSEALEQVPAFPEGTNAMVYAEVAGPAVKMMPSLMPLIQCAAANGGDPDKSWAQMSEQGVDQLRAVRHAISEAVNAKIARAHQEEPGIVKLGLDLAWPEKDLAEILARYRADLDASGLRSVIFGHVYNCNLHVNIIPKDLEEYERGEQLMRKWVTEGMAEGARAFDEHGMGRLKKRLLEK